MTYWLMAISTATFGKSPWAARLPVALSYLASMLFVWLIARHLVRGVEGMAVVVYATMLLPFGAGGWVTTDSLLCAAEAMAVYGFVVYRFSAARKPEYGLLLMWTGFAIGFLTKGPPALVPLGAIAALHLMAPKPTPCRPVWHAAGFALFLLLALPWYVAVVVRHDGLISYFFSAELVDRVATDRFGRNGEWYGWFKVYLPTLLVGTLPWTPAVWRWARRLPGEVSILRGGASREGKAGGAFLTLWILITLGIFCIARSRLPLYILPIFVPLAIVIAASRRADGLGLPRLQWLLPWVVLLLGLRLSSGLFPTDRDSSAWAVAILERATSPVTEVIFIEDMARYGLNLHLGAEVQRVSRELPPQAKFNPTFDGTLWDELKDRGLEDGSIYVTKQLIWPDVAREIDERGYQARPLGLPFEGRIIFEAGRKDSEGTGKSMERCVGGKLAGAGQKRQPSGE